MCAGKSFYADLWQEYIDRREDSVLFVALDPERVPGSSEGRTGSAGRLRRCRDAFVSGALTPEAYTQELLGILCRRRQLYQPGYETANGDWLSPAHLVAPLVWAALGLDTPARLNRSRLQAQLETLCRQLGANDAETAARLHAALAGNALGRALTALCSRVEEKYQSALRRQAKDLPDGRSYLLELTRQALTCAVHQDVKQFFYDRGVTAAEPAKAKKRRAANGAPEGGETARVKTGKTLALLDRWVERYGSWPEREQGLAAAPVGAEQCEQVYKVLLQSGREDVLFPLRVDSVTGCALYIVGKQYYRQWYRRDPDPRRRAQALRMLERRQKCCCYAVLSLDRSGGADGRPGFLLDDTGFDYFPTAQVAMDEFKLFCEDAAEELLQALRGLPPAAFAAFSLSPARTEPEALDRQAVLQADRAALARLARPRSRADKAAAKAGR